MVLRGGVFMKRYITMAIVLICTVLAGAIVFAHFFSYGPNMKIRYRRFLNYTFDGNYSMQLASKKKGEYEDGDTYKERWWNISYTDKNGFSHKASVWSGNTSDYEDTRTTMLVFLHRQAEDIANCEFIDKIASRTFDGEIIEHHYEGMVLSVQLTAGSFIEEKDISPVNGYKLSECDLRSVADAAHITLHVSHEYERMSDHDFEIVQELLENYCEYVGDTSNGVTLVVRDGKNYDVIYQKSIENGEVVQEEWSEK